MSLHPPRRRRPAGFRPRLEALEVRCVPACFTTQSGNVLTITGTAGPDRIQIGDSGNGSISVLCDGNSTPQLFRGVAQVNVQSRGGNDTVHYDLLGNVVALHAIRVNLGAGKDTFLAYLNGFDLNSGADYRINVTGGPGRKTMNVQFGPDPNTALVTTLTQGLNTAPTFPTFPLGGVGLGNTPGVDIPAGAIFRLNLNGGNSADRITVNYQGIIAGQPGTPGTAGTTGANGISPSQGTLVVSINGGGGNDTVTTNILAGSGSLGRVLARENGGAGNDNLTLTIYQQPAAILPFANAAGVGVNAQIDGGPGHNRCTRTPNVLGIRCQSDVVEPSFLVGGVFAPFGTFGSTIGLI
jgi:hypothetical protein